VSDGPLNWSQFFGNDHPVELEVGMGKGLFLLTQAVARPEANFFGIEVVRKYQLYAATRFAIRKLPNVKTSCADAKIVLHDLVPPASVSAVHVLFPDPWWKLKHRKRRVFTPDFATDAARALIPGGKFHIASDVEEYFGVMMEIVKAMPALRVLESTESRGNLEEAGFQTNFERKARQEGTPVWRAVCERTEEPLPRPLPEAGRGEDPQSPSPLRGGVWGGVGPV
jgi:tRNA (guanine-N7-)-methyltransferase